MKRIILTFILIGCVLFGFSQSMVNLTGGYAWTKINASDYISGDPDITGTGWRITGTYDYNPNEGSVAYGFSLGYVSLSATYDGTLDTTELKLSAVPLYFAPKYLFGNEKIKGFAKLAIGGQSATLKKTDSSGTVTVSDFGFYGGAGGGLMFFLNDKVFLNAEYEIAYVTNYYYQSGLIQSASAGIGIKF